MPPAEPGEPSGFCVPLHRGADLAQREGGGGDLLRLERQQQQPWRQEGDAQREWRRRPWVPPTGTADGSCLTVWFWFPGDEVGNGGETRRDALPPGNGGPPLSGEPPGQTDGGGELYGWMREINVNALDA